MNFNQNQEKLENLIKECKFENLLKFLQNMLNINSNFRLNLSEISYELEQLKNK